MSRRDPFSPRLVVFDCDGTLVDSQHNIVAAMTEAWRAFGLEPVNGAAVRRVVGLPLVEAIALLFPEGERRDHITLSDLYKDAFRTLRQQSDHHEPLYPGAIETLDSLEDDGILLAVATGKSRRGLDATLDRHGLTGRFTVLKTADDAPGKPNPDMLLAAMDETGASPGTTVMIGDTVFDIEMAINARTPAIGVSWGYHEPAELISAGASEIVERFGDVVRAVATLWGVSDATG
ncbi:MAG: HAD-IA family hydrolase [Rhodospirillales bacterium]|nr:MAG: HAD-IA family hydrolase [Rhodospirillales bacterium]